jgi:DNA excision repair protein ERCC-3
MIATLREYAKYSVPEGVAQEIEALGRRYGLAVIERDEAGLGLVLRVADPPLAELLARDRKVAPLLGERLAERVFRVRLGVRGLLKQALVAIGYPADDLAGYSEGQELPLRLREPGAATASHSWFVITSGRRRRRSIRTARRGAAAE